MAFINTNRNFDPKSFDPNTYQTSLDTYNGLIKNDPYEPTFSIDLETGKVTSVAGISRYNKVTIGDYEFPGTSVIKVKREKKVSIEKGKKGAGNKVVDTGIDLAKVSITTDLFNNNQIDEFNDILTFFEGKKGLKVKVVDTSSQKSNAKVIPGFSIVNPVTTVRGVNNVYLESIEGPEFSGGKTTYVTNWVEIMIPKKVNTNNISISVQKDIGDILSNELDVYQGRPSKDPALTQPPGTQQTKRKPG